ncbi:MAG TPA: hypothetical protein VNP73_01520, partial [Actinomycetota bacterium]|nr:hypothetical protein [Actinomycetota bacterium]
GKGADALFGGAGDDHLESGGGAEVYFGRDRADDLLDGGAGKDYFDAHDVDKRGRATVQMVSLTRGIAVGEGRDQMRRVENVEVSGNGSVIRGDKRANLLQGWGKISGGPGADALSHAKEVWGGRGKDLVFDVPIAHLGPGPDEFVGDLGGGNHEVYGGPGDDDIRGGTGGEGADPSGAEADRFFGGPGDDELRGFVGADRLFGRGGDDFLNGGKGRDRAKGGGGRDTCKAEDQRGCERD